MRVVMDQEGFRSPDNEVRIAEDAIPIWFLGDSFTWGWGVRQGEVFSDQLQQLLGSGFRIINRGVNGTGTLQQALVLESIEAELKPGYIGIMVFRNDFDDNLSSNNDSRPYCRMTDDSVEVANLPVASPIGGLGREVLNHSYALSLIIYYYHVVRLSLRAQQSEVLSFGFENREIPDNAIRAMHYSLGRIGNLAAKLGLYPFVVYIPSVQELASPSPSPSPIVRAVERVATNVGMPILDLTNPFRLASNPRHLYFSHDEHWNERGHRLAAEKIGEFIDSSVIKLQ
ncbi:MAG: GDSL-type esterase/lipase family protein [Mariprofundaceae bacterium]